MNEELQKYLIEDLGRSFVTVPFGVYRHVCQETLKEIGHRFPKLKMKDLTVPDIRLLYTRYVYTMEGSCVEFLKSIITGYTDFQWPDEVNKLITQRYWMESAEGKKRSSLDEEEVPDKPGGKRAKLAECSEDDVVSLKTESIESELLNDLDDESYFKGRRSPDFSRFRNPEPPKIKFGSRQEGLRGSGMNPTPPATPRKSNEDCSSPEQTHFIDPRLVKRPHERHRSGSVCSTSSTVDESAASTVSDGSFHSFVSDGSITEGIAKTATDVDSKEWRLRKIGPYPHCRNYTRAEVQDFKVVIGRSSEDPRDLTQGYPRLSRPDRLPREPTEDCKTIPLNYVKDNVQAPYVSEAQLKSTDPFDWKLGESESPNGSPKSFYDGEVKTEEEDEDSDVVIIEDIVEEGEDVHPSNFHMSYTRPRRKETEPKLEPPPEPTMLMDSLPRFELTDIYRPPLLPPPGFPPAFTSVPPPALTSVPPPALSPIAGSVPLPNSSPSGPVSFHSLLGGSIQYSDKSDQINNMVGHSPHLFPSPAMNLPLFPPQKMINEFPTGVPFHYFSTGQYGNMPRQEFSNDPQFRLSQSF